jgi:peptide-methionine (S)-S-oxide reductase
MYLLLACWATQVASLRHLGYRAQNPHHVKSRGAMLFMSNQSRQTSAAVEVCSFSMGCFWAPQKTFSNMDGVLDTMVGYSGGSSANPTYASVCGGDGHIETVRVVFDPAVVSYAQLLDVFMQETKDFQTQGQYQSVVWARSEDQRMVAESRLLVPGVPRVSGDPGGLIRPAEAFYPAEDYHDGYLAKAGPRNILLAVSLLGTLGPLLPPLPQSLSASISQTVLLNVPSWLHVQSIPAACSVLYIAIFVLERALDKRKEPIL